MLQDNSRTTYRDVMLMGLVAGLSLGVLNAILYLFFLFPMVAHHVFHTYLHYDADVLEFAAGYAGILGIMGMTAGLVASRVDIKKLSNGRIGSELLRQSPVFASDEPSETR